MQNNASVRLPSDVNRNGSELADSKINGSSGGKRLADVLPLSPSNTSNSKLVDYGIRRTSDGTWYQATPRGWDRVTRDDGFQ
jgi:hypothetical protein